MIQVSFSLILFTLGSSNFRVVEQIKFHTIFLIINGNEAFLLIVCGTRHFMLSCEFRSIATTIYLTRELTNYTDT